jgi:hypothetical protein
MQDRRLAIRSGIGSIAERRAKARCGRLPLLRQPVKNRTNLTLRQSCAEIERPAGVRIARTDKTGAPMEAPRKTLNIRYEPAEIERIGRSVTLQGWPWRYRRLDWRRRGEAPQRGDNRRR